MNHNPSQPEITDYRWQVPGHEWRFGPGCRTLVMGIVNITPDSFSDGGRCVTAQSAVVHGLQLLEDGADILDIGGESTRPGAHPVSAAEEMARILPVIRSLRERTALPISVDTWKSEVAEAAIAAGATIVNDISGFTLDPALAGVVARTGVGCVLMHMRGTPQTMQQFTDYTDLASEVTAELAAALERAVAAGIPRDRLVLDPGIGFSKTAEQNHDLIRSLGRFRSTLGRPLLAGPSRKSFIGKLLPGNPPAAERVWGTAAAVTACILYGADIIRVHDVAEMRQAACVADALKGG